MNPRNAEFLLIPVKIGVCRNIISMLAYFPAFLRGYMFSYDIGLTTVTADILQLILCDDTKHRSKGALETGSVHDYSKYGRSVRSRK